MMRVKNRGGKAVNGLLEGELFCALKLPDTIDSLNF